MKTQKIRVSYLNENENKNDNRLHFVKAIKEIAIDGVNGDELIGLKQAKDLCDLIYFGESDYFEINVTNDIDKQEVISEFKEMGIKIEFNDRDKKLKRLLYSNQENLIEDMLMENWEKYVEPELFETLTYNQCKEIGVKNIIKKYKEYIGVEMFYKVTDDINRINQLESKDIGFKFMKFNEEFGEFNAEYIKFKGFTYKEYDKEELISEMADALQVLLSIYNHIGNETNITFSDILEKIIEKNEKWERKIKEYKRNENNKNWI